LVEVKARLLSLRDIHEESEPLLLYRHHFGHLSQEQALRGRKALFLPCLRIASVVDALWGQELDEEVHHYPPHPFHPRGVDLDG